MLYDTLDDLGRKDEYTKYEGRVISIGNLSETLAGIAGGVLIGISLRFPYIVQTGVAFIAIPASLTLIEPKRNIKALNFGFKYILKIVKNSLYDNKALRWNILHSSIFVFHTSNLINAPLSFSQSTLASYKLPGVDLEKLNSLHTFSAQILLFS